MDSLTQMALGAAVGELILGEKVGNKAMIWGAIAGTIPDLDVLSNLFLNDYQSLLFHRSLTHSIFFAVVFSPLLAYLIKKLHSDGTTSYNDWLTLTFWCIVTHPLLDIFTNYGTQIFYPFSDYRIAFNTIFVIDPVYTVSLLIGCLLVFIKGKDVIKRKKVIQISLIISQAYLLLTCLNKWHVEHKVVEKIQRQEISYIEKMTTPAPFSNFLWSVIIKAEDQYWVGYYSLLDGSDDLHLTPIPRNEHLLSEYMPNDKIEKLLEFSKGFYELEKTSNGLIFNDLRFSTISGWFNVNDAYIFSFLLKKEEEDVIISKIAPKERLKMENFKKLFHRIMSENKQTDGN